MGGVKVTLREKPISKGRKSLYLDYYPAIADKKTGKETRREFIKMYVFSDKKELKERIVKLKDAILKREIEGKDIKQQEKELTELEDYYKGFKGLTAAQKVQNLETLKIAESIRQKRHNVLNKPEIYSEHEKEMLRKNEMGEQCFVEYFRKLTNKRENSNYDNWKSTLHYLDEFTGGRIKFADLNSLWLEGFKEYLMTSKRRRSKKATLALGSSASYFNNVLVALKQAYKDAILQYDLTSKVERIKVPETRRQFLTLEELNKLVKTPCKDNLMKRAALFAALTGLRFSDIKKMTWGELDYVDGQGYYLNYDQKKTKGVEVLPISEQAYSLTEGAVNPKTMSQNENVFMGLKYSAYQNKAIHQWISEAGITKHITFHCFRHTYATLQLFNGTDIYTVSKMLGHKDLKTTQLYAKVVDEAKREATNRIMLDM